MKERERERNLSKLVKKDKNTQLKRRRISGQKPEIKEEKSPHDGLLHQKQTKNMIKSG